MTVFELFEIDHNGLRTDLGVTDRLEFAINWARLFLNSDALYLGKEIADYDNVCEEFETADSVFLMTDPIAVHGVVVFKKTINEPHFHVR
ncbi:hypothetical protein FNH22_06440 [Fulvivirga sp. M361]|uniref:hypothetical protein n=1 Tax=Fulvivirga sp. M361 TaxID=2594266 RepID=UPI00117A6522|nr:hypothetical protein [Fulvivirga sp. M361]TRX60679.1 hypothetical protein FNH22_06440 [Fulvivirga sp. M361]